jgi:PIN domain nuclease of toxin-antitoxin system
MRLLLDTHTFLWWVEDSPRLPRRFHAAIAEPANDVFVSAVTVWEIAIKRRTGRIAFSGGIVEEIRSHGFQPLPIALGHTEAVEDLPVFHRDPFDRMLVAQAMVEEIILLTVDAQIIKYAPNVRLFR